MSRFHEPQHPDFQRLNASIGYDQRLWPQDIAQSRAHAKMLAAQGIIGESDRDELLAGLDAVAAELTDGSFPFAFIGGLCLLGAFLAGLGAGRL